MQQKNIFFKASPNLAGVSGRGHFHGRPAKKAGFGF